MQTENLPMWAPVHGWQKKWIQPKPSAIAATLGSRPGNTMRPAPNDYQFYQWQRQERVVPVENIDTKGIIELSTYPVAEEPVPEIVDIADLIPVVDDTPPIQEI